MAPAFNLCDGGQFCLPDVVILLSAATVPDLGQGIYMWATTLHGWRTGRATMTTPC